MTAPLSRNRNYRLLWASQALSEFGLHASMIAFPLLVLAVTGSAVVSGLVLGTIAAAQLIAGLPAGALVDRWSRKKVMLCCEAAEMAAAASLVGALWWNRPSVAHMVVVAAVLGVSGALFEPAEEACLPNLVPTEQLSTAVAMNSARSSLGQLSGTAAGGFLFAVGRAVPFAVDVLTHALAFVGLAFLRVPAREQRREPMRHLGREISAGLRWVWRQPQVRVMTLCAVVLNLFFSAFYILIIVLATERGVPEGEIGVMAAMLGVGGVLGSLLAPYARRMMSPHLSIAAVFWVLTLLTPVAAFIQNGYVMGVLFAAIALLPPTANTTIITEQLLLTEDAMRGRLSAVLGVATGVAAAAGPALGGFLVAAVPGGQAVLVCAAGMAVVTVVVTVSPTLRRFSGHGVDDEPAAAENNREPHVEPVATAAPEVVRHQSRSVIFGQVTGCSSTPLAGAAVTLIDVVGRQVDRDRPNSRGHFRLGPPTGGTYLVVCSAPLHRPAAARVTVADVPIRHDVVLAGAGASLSGRVFAAGSRQPIAGASVTLVNLHGSVMMTTADPDGCFGFLELAQGPYTLTVAARSGRPVAHHVELPGQGRFTHDVEITARGQLVGRVRTASAGAPVPEALTTLINSTGQVVASALTDTEGGFVFDDLPAAPYTIVAIGYPPVAAGVHLTGGPPTEAVITLRPPTVTSPAGNGITSSSQHRHGVACDDGQRDRYPQWTG